MKSNKKLLISVLVIAVTTLVAGAATFAFFSARRTASTNKFAVGTLDLNVNSGGTDNEPFVIENMGENGNLSGSKSWTVKNTGTLPGRLLFRIQNLTNDENGCNDPEIEAEPNCANDNLGELGALITLHVSLDGTEQVSSTLATDQEAKIGQDWNALTPIILQPGEERTLTLNWALDENAYGNEIQSDSVSFDANFRLIQQIAGPSPTN